MVHDLDSVWISQPLYGLHLLVWNSVSLHSLDDSLVNISMVILMAVRITYSWLMMPVHKCGDA